MQSKASSKAPPLKPFQPPPTYKEQVASGVPFGKRILHGKEHQTAWQMSIGLSMFLAFVMTPYLGKRLARDAEFRDKIPSWYTNSYRIEQPRPSKSREERHQELVAMQKDLHERAIRGEFTEENLKKMQLLGPDEPNGWARIHPGEDEDDDDDDEEEE